MVQSGTSTCAGHMPTRAVPALGCTQVDHKVSFQHIHLSQQQYILDMLQRYGFESCTPVSTPMNPGTCLSSAQSPSTPEEVEEMRTIPYISAVGSLIYLAISTRPDISHSVGVLARFNTNPGKVHWAAV